MQNWTKPILNLTQDTKSPNKNQKRGTLLKSLK